MRDQVEKFVPEFIEWGSPQPEESAAEEPLARMPRCGKQAKRSAPRAA